MGRVEDPVAIKDKFRDYLDDVYNIQNHIEEKVYETKIKNRSKYINKNQVKQLINLLHRDYHKLNINIKFVHNDLHGKLINFSKILPFYNENAGIAYFNYLDKIIYVSDHKHKISDINKSKLYITLSLYHEMRHAWQSIYRPRKFIHNVVHYKSSGNEYLSQWVERDAMEFSIRMMNRNKDAINKILGIDWNWTAEYGEFDEIKNN